jgi:hypothetical protein
MDPVNTHQGTSKGISEKRRAQRYITGRALCIMSKKLVSSAARLAGGSSPL